MIIPTRDCWKCFGAIEVESRDFTEFCPHCGAYDPHGSPEEQSFAMHYRNGREAKNGDRIVQIGNYGSGKAAIVAVGVLYDATPGNDYCNGGIAQTQCPNTGACICDCMHVDDLAAILAEKGLDKRPAGK